MRNNLSPLVWGLRRVVGVYYCQVISVAAWFNTVNGSGKEGDRDNGKTSWFNFRFFSFSQRKLIRQQRSNSKVIRRIPEGAESVHPCASYVSFVHHAHWTVELPRFRLSVLTSCCVPPFFWYFDFNDINCKHGLSPSLTSLPAFFSFLYAFFKWNYWRNHLTISSFGWQFYFQWFEGCGPTHLPIPLHTMLFGIP